MGIKDFSTGVWARLGGWDSWIAWENPIPQKETAGLQDPPSLPNHFSLVEAGEGWGLV